MTDHKYTVEDTSNVGSSTSIGGRRVVFNKELVSDEKISAVVRAMFESSTGKRCDFNSISIMSAFSMLLMHNNLSLSSSADIEKLEKFVEVNKEGKTLPWKSSEERAMFGSDFPVIEQLMWATLLEGYKKDERTKAKLLESDKSLSGISLTDPEVLFIKEVNEVFKSLYGKYPIHPEDDKKVKNIIARAASLMHSVAKNSYEDKNRNKIILDAVAKFIVSIDDTMDTINKVEDIRRKELAEGKDKLLLTREYSISDKEIVLKEKLKELESIEKGIPELLKDRYKTLVGSL